MFTDNDGQNMGTRIFMKIKLLIPWNISILQVYNEDSTVEFIYG